MNEGYGFTTEKGQLCIVPVRENIFRVIYTKAEEIKTPSFLISARPETVSAKCVQDEDAMTVTTAKLQAVVDKATLAITWRRADGSVYVTETARTLVPHDVIHYTTGNEKPVIERVKTVDGERNFIKNLKEITDRTAYRGKLHFDWADDEGIYGLGQGEEGIYNYRHHVQYLYQHNMRIPMPVYVSTRRYGILFDCASLMTFNDDENGSYLFMDTVSQMDYYFMAGDCLDDLVADYRCLTGAAVMLPKWAFGYVQSKEAYHTEDELIETVQHYRDLDVPLDCIVQDWNTWEPGKWGQKTVDKTRYPHLPEAMRKIHDMHVHTMVSVWPNMNPGVSDHSELFEAGYLLGDYSTYDAFSKEAREMYWKQADRELFSGGFDSWWCDSTEPFSGPDWSGAVKREPWERFEIVGGEHKKYLDAEVANAFALVHAKGIYENQRKETEEKRVLNLTRSGYASGQKYGTVLWSGDTCATWENFRKQIREGLNFAMSGMPYWTLDIGAFFTVGSAWQKRGCNCNTNPDPLWFWQGEYNDGVADEGYRELYVRWFEYGAFLPMFRSHGTDTPREIWNFGAKGDPAYDAIERYIKLRYHLMPYVYSLAGAVHLESATMLRSLLFDFMEDDQVREIWDEFMFGPSLLVCPVTEAMYCEADNHKTNRDKKRNCYLPKGHVWYDYLTGERFEGGVEIEASAPLDWIPLYVKGGSIIPTVEELQYADDTPKDAMEIHVYPGEDGFFAFYEDEGDSYRYEDGAYSLIPMSWDDAKKELTIGKREGSFAGMLKERTFVVVIGDRREEVPYHGDAVVVK